MFFLLFLCFLGWFCFFFLILRLRKSFNDPFKLPSYIMDDPKEIQEMREIFSDFCSKQEKNANYKQSAAIVSNIISSNKILKVEDLIRSNAKRIFWLHRLCGDIPEGGLGVRLTVQWNLFGGTIANLGSKQQLDWLRDVFSRGELGCFLLTENSAGVLSGLIVNTIAQWNGNEFILSSEDPKNHSRKYWISQGLCAKWGVVIARLILKNGEDKGPHAFIIDMEAEGVKRDDMPRKTDFNSLDNAWVEFNNVKLSRESLLSGISYINEDGEYKLVNENEPFSFVTVAQRLLSGRICIAGCSLMQLKNILNSVEEYGNSRLIPTGRNETTPLSSLPIMRDLLYRQRCIIKVFEQYIITLENEFMTAKTLSNKLVDKIACAKIETIAFAIDSLYELKIGVGSLSLFEHGPFGSKNDILYVFRFAEGDSAILQQKLSRDSLKLLRSPFGLLKEIINIPKSFICNTDQIGLYRASLSYSLVSLALKLKNIPKDKLTKVWLENHKIIKNIAHKKALLTILETVKPKMKNTKEYEMFKQYYLI